MPDQQHPRPSLPLIGKSRPRSPKDTATSLTSSTLLRPLSQMVCYQLITFFILYAYCSCLRRGLAQRFIMTARSMPLPLTATEPVPPPALRPWLPSEILPVQLKTTTRPFADSSSNLQLDPTFQPEPPAPSLPPWTTTTKMPRAAPSVSLMCPHSAHWPTILPSPARIRPQLRRVAADATPPPASIRFTWATLYLTSARMCQTSQKSVSLHLERKPWPTLKRLA